MTFLEAITLSLARAGETYNDVETETLLVVKNAINQAYMMLSALDRRTKDTTVQYTKTIKLPDDFMSLMRLTHDKIGELSSIDFEERADSIIIRTRDIKDGNITISYAYYPPLLAQDTDNIQLKDVYTAHLTAFGAYAIQLLKKKYANAQLLLAEFNQVIGGKSNGIQ